MSLKIRFAKTRNSRNFFRVVVCETRSKRDGKVVDFLGFYKVGKNPLMQIDEKKYQEWRKKGAQVSAALQKLLKK